MSSNDPYTDQGDFAEPMADAAQTGEQAATEGLAPAGQQQPSMSGSFAGEQFSTAELRPAADQAAGGEATVPGAMEPAPSAAPPAAVAPMGEASGTLPDDAPVGPAHAELDAARLHVPGPAELADDMDRSDLDAQQSGA